MSTVESTLFPKDGSPGLPNNRPARPTQKRSRFAGERAGALLFAASFSIGVWGLALKVLTPSPSGVVPSVDRVAVIVPAASRDGKATVQWTFAPREAMEGYPILGGAPVFPLSDARTSITDRR